MLDIGKNNSIIWLMSSVLGVYNRV